MRNGNGRGVGTTVVVLAGSGLAATGPAGASLESPGLAGPVVPGREAGGDGVGGGASAFRERMGRIVAGRVARPALVGFRSQSASSNELHTDLEAVGALVRQGPEDDEADDDVLPQDVAGRRAGSRVPTLPLVALGPDSTDRTAACRRHLRRGGVA